jgi:Putative beta-barrel porin-2, OmpL-like. bbp2
LDSEEETADSGDVGQLAVYALGRIGSIGQRRIKRRPGKTIGVTPVMKLNKLTLLASLLAVPVGSLAGNAAAQESGPIFNSAVDYGQLPLMPSDVVETPLEAPVVAPEMGTAVESEHYPSADHGSSAGQAGCSTGCATSCGQGCDEYSLARHGVGIFDPQFLNGRCRGDEPFSLIGNRMGFDIGGWAQLGYHDRNLPQFNRRKHEYQLQQMWAYAERAVDGSQGFDLGGRIDYLYGTDGPDTQSFGIDNDHWDNGWDNGPDYGHAIPQLYVEAAYGDWSIKAGHFFTLIGYEVVAAPDNFFYSHAYTMYNSEPFTHTGTLATYNYTEDIKLYGGWVFGWDSGFEDNGDAYLGGASVDLTDDLNVTSTLVAGRFSDNLSSEERGFMSSTVATAHLTECTRYVFQTDILDSEDAAGATVRDTFGINQYLFRDFSSRFGIGARMEWWNVNADSAGFRGDAASTTFDYVGDYDVYALTLGANFRPHPNLIIRPEIRWDHVFGDKDTRTAADLALLENDADHQTTFGIDTIFLY